MELEKMGKKRSGNFKINRRTQEELIGTHSIKDT